MFPALAAPAVLSIVAAMATAVPDPPVLVSTPGVFASCTSDFPGFQTGIYYPDAEVEPWVAANPANPMNLIATWQQDRWSNGGARGLVSATSFDGGATWASVPVPGVSACTGGTLLRASDPWVTFAPNGDAYHIALVFGVGAGALNQIAVNRSRDGGLTWEPPLVVAGDSGAAFNDKESITADPTDPNYVYAVWDRLDFGTGRGPAMFSRTTDGGGYWEIARVAHDPGAGAQTIGNQLVVLPDGTLMLFFMEIYGSPFGDEYLISYKRSTNKGLFWTPANTALRAPAITPWGTGDPDRRRRIRDAAGLFDVAVDPRNGYLYLVWQDGFLGGPPIAATGFTMSKDGGATWSKPIIANRTPQGIPDLYRQALIPSVHVTDEGTIGVSYFDFRNNTPDPDGLTDHWLAWCHPQGSDCADPDRWQEVRLTDPSFDILQAPVVAQGIFLGDYLGLASSDRDFISVFTQPHGADRSSPFSSRVRLTPALDPKGLGWWKRQVFTPVAGDALDQIHAIHDLFDEVGDPAALAAVLSPSQPAGPLGRARQHLMALLLNITSGRLSPFARMPDGRTVGEAAASLVAVVSDPLSLRAELEAAKDLAERIDEGRVELR